MGDLNDQVTPLRMTDNFENTVFEAKMAGHTIAPPGFDKSQSAGINGNGLTNSYTGMSTNYPDSDFTKNANPEIKAFENLLRTPELTRNCANGFIKDDQNGNNTSMSQIANQAEVEKELTGEFAGSLISPARVSPESLWLTDIPSIRVTGIFGVPSTCPAYTTTDSNADNYETASCQFQPTVNCCLGESGVKMNAITAVDKYLTDSVIDSFSSLQTHYPSICSHHQEAKEQDGLAGVRKCHSATEDASVYQGDSLVKQMMVGLRSQLTAHQRLPTNQIANPDPNCNYCTAKAYDLQLGSRDEVIPTEFNRQEVDWNLRQIHCTTEFPGSARIPVETRCDLLATHTRRHQAFVPPISTNEYTEQPMRHPMSAYSLTPPYCSEQPDGAMSVGLRDNQFQETMQMMMPRACPRLSPPYSSMDAMSVVGKSNHDYIKSCAINNRYATQKLCQRYSQLGQHVDQCFNQLYENLRSRRNILMDKLNTVYQMKLNSLNMQLQSMHTLEVALCKGQMPVEAVQRKLELYSIPSDDDAITLHMDDDIWKIQNSIDRCGQIATNACASLSFICKDSLINIGHPRTASCAPSPFSCVLVKKPFRVEVQTKNYLGILMTRGGDVVQASIIHANGQTYTAHVCDCKTGRYLITTMFLNAGQYLMTVSVNGKMIKDAPLQIFAHSGSFDDPSDSSRGNVAPTNKTISNRYRPYWSSSSALFQRRQRKFTIQFVPTLTALEHGREANQNLIEIMSTPPTTLSKSRLSDGSTITSCSMFCRPWGVCTDSLDNIYVADRSNNHIKIFNVDGCRVLILGRQGRNQSEFDRPSGVTFDRILQRLIVCDKDNHRIQVFNCNPNIVKQMCLSDGNTHAEMTENDEPSNNSPSNQFIYKYSHSLFIELTWKPLNMFGSRGNYVGEFHYPWDCATNSHSEIIVTDTRNHRIQMFTSDGVFIRKFGFDGLLWKRFDSPRGVTVTTDDKVIVSDFNNHKIVVFEPGFVNERYMGGEGDEQGKLKRPQGVCVDQHGNILVADSRNYRIQAFSTKGDFRYQFGSFGEDNGDEMDRPAGICVANNGTVFVVDFGNNRVLAF